eukprot:5785125-Heterocapsa_arctica.AAC.1
MPPTTLIFMPPITLFHILSGQLPGPLISMPPIPLFHILTGQLAGCLLPAAGSLLPAACCRQGQRGATHAAS